MPQLHSASGSPRVTRNPSSGGQPMTFRQTVAVLMTSLAALMLPGTAAAQTYAFDCFTDGTPADCAVGEAQFRVQVDSTSSGQARFVFRNVGTRSSAIADIHFDDGDTRRLQSLSSVINGSGVSFRQGASPPNLNFGNLIDFNTTGGLSADADNPVVSNGVNPGEMLTLLFTLRSGATFANVIADLRSGDLRIGLRGQGFSTGGAESFVNLAVPVPEASTTVLLAGGLLLLAGMLRRRQA